MCFVGEVKEKEEVDTPKEGVKRKKKKHQRKKVQHDFSSGQQVRIYGPKGSTKWVGPYTALRIFPKGAIHVGNEGEGGFFQGPLQDIGQSWRPWKRRRGRH